jgi:hypothetical protein
VLANFCARGRGDQVTLADLEAPRRTLPQGGCMSDPADPGGDGGQRSPRPRSKREVLPRLDAVVGDGDWPFARARFRDRAERLRRLGTTPTAC